MILNEKKTPGLRWLYMLLAVSLIPACSGKPGDPREAINRMYDAYGGRENVALLTSYTGKGYMKQLPTAGVAKSYPFDVYQKDKLYKTVTYRLRRGELEDIQILAVNDDERLVWSRSGGFKTLPSWEVALQRYRFPFVMTWLDGPGAGGERVVDEDSYGKYKIRYDLDEDILTLVLDDSEWLLREIRLENSVDSTFLFREEYGDYRKVDGIPFPNRFTGFLAERKYYEYLIPAIELGAEMDEDLFRITAEDTTQMMEAVKDTVR